MMEESSVDDLFPGVESGDSPRRKRAQSFRPYVQNESHLFPASTNDYVEAGHPARVVSELIDHMDLGDLYDSYRGGGTSAYDPRMMLKVWVLGYFSRIYTGRRLAKALRENIAFLWISGGQKPDFRTLNLFRRRLESSLHSIFQQIVLFAFDEGVITPREVFVDHTKLEANANRHRFYWRKMAERNLEKIQSEFDELYEHIAALNEKENLQYGKRDLEEMERGRVSADSIQRFLDSTNAALKAGHTDRTVAGYAKKNSAEFMN